MKKQINDYFLCLTGITNFSPDHDKILKYF